MLIMETGAKIRRLYHVENHSIKEIARRLKISKNTVRRVLRAEGAGRTYQREKTTKPKLEKYEETLRSWLESDKKLPKKKRPNATHYHKELKKLGYTGAYDSIQRYVKKWLTDNNKNTNAYIPLTFSPGEAYQFDWSDQSVEIAGATTKIKVAHFKLCYSRKFFLIAYLRETHEMLFDAHDKAFAFFEGVTKRGIYDNMRTAVNKIKTGKDRDFNKQFLSMVDHYMIDPTACNPASGWEKGQVENNVNTIRNWIFIPKLCVDSLDDLNKHLAKRCQEISESRDHPEQNDKKIESVFLTEKDHLRKFETPYHGYLEIEAKVSSTCIVNFDNNRYSVDSIAASQHVTIRSYPTKVEVFYKDKLIASHERIFLKNKSILNPYHYLSLLDRKPGAVRNGAPFKNWKLPKSIVEVKDILLERKGGDRECVNVLLQLRNYSLEDVGFACEMALCEKVINSDYILNILSRSNAQAKPEEIEIPESLQLKTDPTDDCERYNELLNKGDHNEPNKS